MSRFLKDKSISQIGFCHKLQQALFPGKHLKPFFIIVPGLKPVNTRTTCKKCNAICREPLSTRRVAGSPIKKRAFPELRESSFFFGRAIFRLLGAGEVSLRRALRRRVIAEKPLPLRLPLSVQALPRPRYRPLWRRCSCRGSGRGFRKGSAAMP